MSKFKWISALAMMSVSGIALASGGFSGAGSSGGIGPPTRVVDEVYEFGKSVYKGRVKGAEKIKYCVKVDGEVKKLKRSTAKAYKEGPARDFALALIDCESPDRLALTTMPREHVPIVLYYLNKRFKLKLSDDEASG